MSVLLETQFAVDTASAPSPGDLRAWVEGALAAAQCPAATESCVVELRVVGTDEGRALNRRFRGVDRPTNVLAFPAGSGPWPPDEPRSLGELVICAPVLEAEAEEQGKAPRAHWCHLVVHGALHLAGLDHQSDAEAQAMEALERTVLAQFSFPDPYASRESDD